MANQKKHYTLAERLAMQNTNQMEVGSDYHIKAVDSVIEFTDSKTGEIRKAVIVECDDGKYYLPNTIANSYLEEIETDEAGARAALEGHTFKCVQFNARRYGTKGRTLQIVS